MLYDTICEIWPQYKERSRREVERAFLKKYPVVDRYTGLASLSREGSDPLHLWEEL